jgi:hypothetical protein
MIGDDQPRDGTVLFDPELNGPSCAELERIREQIHDDLFNAKPIPFADKVGRRAKLDWRLCPLRRFVETTGDITEDCGKIDLFEFESQTPSGDSRNIHRRMWLR